MRTVHYFTLFFLLIIFTTSQAEVRLPKIFSDNMILQRDQATTIWGWASPGEEIHISFLENEYRLKADISGEWSLVFPPVQAGGPYELVIRGENKIQLKNLLFGDVWICSGQSNMHFKVKSSRFAFKEIEQANYDKIRLFQIDQDSHWQPKKDLDSGKWQICTPDNVNHFSAVAYYFGRELYEEMEIPIGLVQATWGGSSIQAWMSRESFRAFSEYRDLVEEIETTPDFFEQRMTEYKQKGGDLLVNMIFKRSSLLTEDGLLSENFSIKEDEWKSIEIPGYWETSVLPGYDGTVWYRKIVNIPPAFKGKDLELDLGWIDDYDFTFFNRRPVGETFYKGSSRTYQIPAEITDSVKNEILICVYDEGGWGGFWGPHRPQLKLTDEHENLNIDLAGLWQLKTEIEKEDLISGEWNPLPRKRSIPTFLFNAMISPLTQYSIKGVIWYQGESNANNAEEYNKLFPAMINGWRDAWGQGDFPFLFVQLPNYGFSNKTPGQSNWAEFREVQSNALTLANTGMAVTIDLGDKMDIHPDNKQDVGKRLALSALEVAYNRDVICSGPVFHSMEQADGKIYLKFTQTGNGLLAKDKFGYLKEFEISGKDQRFVWAKAYIDGDKVVVYNESVSEPVAVRYAWSDNPNQANLYNKEGLPASPFRTDKYIE